MVFIDNTVRSRIRLENKYVTSESEARRKGNGKGNREIIEGPVHGIKHGAAEKHNLRDPV